MKAALHICRFDTTGELTGKNLTYENLKRAVLAAGRFSVFEATQSGKHAALFNRLCRDEELVTDHEKYGFPWTAVRLKDATVKDGQ